MYLNQFSVRIPEGEEVSGGYVNMVHGRQYTVMLRNDRATRCDVQVEIDGKGIGSFRLAAHQSMSLERQPHDHGRFTFYKLGTSEAHDAQLQDNPALGLIRVTFTPEVNPVVRPLSPVVQVLYASDSMPMASPYVSSRSAGGTGLSGTSNQQFVAVESMDLDYSQQTVIHLRLVAQDT